MKITDKKRLVFLWALLPVVNAAAYLLMNLVDVRIWIFLRPIFEVSIVSVVCILGFIFLTGLSGYSFAKVGVGAPVAILAGNAVPILCNVLLLILTVAGAGIDADGSAAAVFSLFGNGFFACLAGYFFNIANSLSDMTQAFISLAIILASFIVGYSLGALNRQKKK